MKQAEYVLSVGFDKTQKITNAIQTQQSLSQNLKYNPFACYYFDGIILIGYEKSKLGMLNLNLLEQNGVPEQEHNCPLESPICDVALSAKYVAVATVDGRIYFAEIEWKAETKQFSFKDLIAFKAHRKEVSKDKQKQSQGKEENELFCINSIGFNVRFEMWLFSLGNDGIGYFWDCKSKNKISCFQYDKLPACKGKCSADGQVFVYCLGYDWSQGIWGCPSVNYRPKLCAHLVTGKELEHSK